MEASKAKGRGGEGAADGNTLDIRPGGMFVQKRESGTTESSAIPPTINVKVKFGDSRRDIRIRPQASFGELKKLLTEYTRIHHLDQRVFFKKVERHSKEFLDESGVKDGSKLVVLEDPKARDRRCLEMVQYSTAEIARESLHRIGCDVGRIERDVKACEAAVSRGEKVDEKRADELIDALMSKLVALNGIHINGNLKMEKNLLVMIYWDLLSNCIIDSQEGRVKKLVEDLDSLKVKKKSRRRVRFNLQEEILNTTEHHPKLDDVVFTTKWVTFEE